MGAPLVALGIAARELLRKGFVHKAVTEAAKKKLVKDVTKKHGADAVKDAKKQLSQPKIKGLIKDTETALSAGKNIIKGGGGLKAASAAARKVRSEQAATKAASKKGSNVGSGLIAATAGAKAATKFQEAARKFAGKKGSNVGGGIIAGSAGAKAATKAFTKKK